MSSALGTPEVREWEGEKPCLGLAAGGRRGPYSAVSLSCSAFTANLWSPFAPQNLATHWDWVFACMGCVHTFCPSLKKSRKKKMREMCMYQNAFGNILLFLMILKSYPLSVCSSLLKPLLYKNSEFRKSFMDRKYLSAKKLAFVFKF